MLTEKQKTERLSYIGGSDAAAVLGLSRWGTPLSVWAEKTGQIVRKESDALHQKLGHKLEQTVAELFMEETGKKLNRVNETIFHPNYNFIGANLDRRVVGENSLFEAKTVSAWKSDEWDGDEIPREYILQAIHYLAVTGMDRAYIAVLIGNQEFKWKTIERSDVLESMKDMVRREVAFWNDFVIPKIMPTIITARDKDTLDELFPSAEEGPPLILTDEANALAESLEGMAADHKALGNQIEKAKNELRVMLGSHASGSTDNWLIKWQNVAACSFTVNKPASRRLSYKRKSKED